MPIYEYNCQDCGKKSSLFFRTFSSVGPAQCPQCDSQEMNRVVSKVSILKSWGNSLNWMPSMETLGDVDQDDPVAMESWLHRNRKEMGTELGDSFADNLARMDAGISPPWFDTPDNDLGLGDE